MKARKLLILLILLVGIGVYGYRHLSPVKRPARTRESVRNADTIARAYQERFSNIRVHGSGTVVRVLRDDTKGSRHQRFLVRLPSGLTVLVVHNIDLAPRIEGLKAGERVEFYGEYEWNPKGGVVHWTHHDPGRRHPGGWIRFHGRRYQ